MMYGRVIACASWAIFILFLCATLVWSAEDAGQQVYEDTCLMCHGETGKADTRAGEMMKVPDLTETEWKSGTSQEEVEEVIRSGVGKMPKYEEKLTAAEIEAVARYVRELCGVADSD